MSTIHLLFPTPVKQTYLPRPFTPDEIQFFHEQSLNRVKNTHNELNKNYYVLHEPQLAGLKSFIEEELRDYLAQTYNPSPDVEHYLTQSWLNYTKTGQRHHRHAHPNSLYSGVFYVTADRNQDTITFFRDDGYQRISVQGDPTYDFEPSRTLDVETGMLLIFPSNQIHEVRTAPGVEERVSLAFNVFVRGLLKPGGQLLSELKL